MKKGLIVGLLAVVLCLSVVGCKKKDGLVGEWAYESNGTVSSTFVYVFNEDKTCSYAGKKCTYTVDGDKLSILNDGDTVPFETTFKIEDDKLTIKDSLGSDVVYARK